MPQKKKLAKKIAPKKVKKLPAEQESEVTKTAQISAPKSHKYLIFKIVIWTLTILFFGSGFIFLNILDYQGCDHSLSVLNSLRDIADWIRVIYLIGLTIWPVALFCILKKRPVSIVFFVLYLLSLPVLTELIDVSKNVLYLCIVIYTFVLIFFLIKARKFLWFLFYLLWGIFCIGLFLHVDEIWNRCQTYDEGGCYIGKPIIYLYPKEKTDVSVQVAYPEKFTHTYPHYTNGWFVEASPNGDLVDKTTGRNLYALYWEGKETNHNQNPTEGFVVAGQDTISFLETKLAQLGLTEREANEFIIYWLPKLEGEKYNFIRFQTKAEQDTNMPLLIEPKPDTVIRVLMEYDDLDGPIMVQEQVLPPTPVRTGFTVVEWGGTELDID